LLREDNADLRLTEKGWELGLVDESRWQAFEQKRESVAQLQHELSKQWVRVGTEQARQAETLWGKELKKEASMMSLLKRPEVDVENLLQFAGVENIPEQVAEQVAVQAKYAGYIDRQQTEINRTKRYNHLKLPTDEDYSNVPGLSNEVSEKLKEQKPETLGQASRIPGITPAAISLLLVHLKKKAG
jgi:tRNA uridine 5-carboxymethylaminomethyl modification enzyme